MRKEHFGRRTYLDDRDTPIIESQTANVSALPVVASPPLADVIVQDDAGRFRLGIHDNDSPGFETRDYAEASGCGRPGTIH
jgi:hypothetical protein